MKKLALVVCFFAITTSALAQGELERPAGREALFEAIEAGEKQAVVKILSKRRHVKLNHRELWDGETFLIEAIRAEQPEIVDLLLRHGADPNLREIGGVDDQDQKILGDTPLTAALELDSTEMVGILLKHGIRLAHNPSALHSANSIEMIGFLLNHGALINGRNENGETYLQVAAQEAGNDAELEEVVQLLIERGANVNFADNDGETPLLRCQSVEIAELLIKKGANVNASNKSGLTPLHLAAFEEARIEIARLLISHGADVNARNNEGYTPLDFLVADAFDHDFALLLVSHGALINEELVRRYELTEEFEKIRREIATGVQPDPQGA